MVDQVYLTFKVQNDPIVDELVVDSGEMPPVHLIAISRSPEHTGDTKQGLLKAPFQFHNSSSILAVSSSRKDDFKIRSSH